MARSDDKTVIEMPDGPPDATGLTPRQQRVLATIKDSIETKGYPPSMREIGQAVGLTSSSSVAHQLRVLEGKGFLKRDPNRPRALEVFLPEVMAARRSMSSGEESSVVRPLAGSEAKRPVCEPGRGTSPRARTSRTSWKDRVRRSLAKLRLARRHELLQAFNLSANLSRERRQRHAPRQVAQLSAFGLAERSVDQVTVPAGVDLVGSEHEGHMQG